TGAADFARAALEGVALQVVDLVETALQDCAENQKPGFLKKPGFLGISMGELRVDGGMARNDFFLQMQADLLGRPLLRSTQTEATALGAAYLAGFKAGFWSNLDELRRLPRSVQR